MSTVEHLNDDVLERYAMRGLSEPEAEAVEDHIALCSVCLDRLDETTAFVEGMRAATHAPVSEYQPKLRLPTWLEHGWLEHVTRPKWALPVLGAVVLAAGLVFVTLRPEVLPPAAMVVLDGTRGASTEVHGTGPFDFELFMPAEGTAYHVELLDEGGQKQWEGDVPGKNGKLHALVQRKIAEGQYFLEVTEPASGSKHEYAVHVVK
jgi:hypothetical protein